MIRSKLICPKKNLISLQYRTYLYIEYLTGLKFGMYRYKSWDHVEYFMKSLNKLD